MKHDQIEIRTADGVCPTHVFTPDGDGPFPTAILYMDGIGMRPTIVAMAERLAGEDYVVLAPDLFYRFGPTDLGDPVKARTDPATRELFAERFKSTNATLATRDTEAFLAYLDSRGDVTRAVGVTGYCMGGAMVLTAAATYPDRIRAAASFHGGNLATDAPNSPHLLAPKIKAKVYVAAADKDVHSPPEMEVRLDAALTAAGVDHVCETYAGALHGWTMADLPIYDEAAAERGWRELVGLFAATLR